MRIEVSIVNGEHPAHTALPAADGSRSNMSLVISVDAADPAVLPALDAERLARLVRGVLDPDPSAGRAPYADRLPVRQGNSIVVLRKRDVEWIEAQGNYVLVHAGRTSYTVRDTIRGIEGQLDPNRFRRIHRSAIVNLEKIRELRPQSHGDVRIVLDSGVQVTMSRSYRPALASLLQAAD